MAEVLLFHHIQGLTPGVQAFADDLRAGGHTVHTPDLYGGRTFATIEEGAAFSQVPTPPTSTPWPTSRPTTCRRVWCSPGSPRG